MKSFKEEIVDNDEILNFVDDIKILIKKDRYNNDSMKDFKKDYPDEIEKLEEALLTYMGEIDLEILKTGFPDKWKYLTKKSAYAYEFFNSIDDYQKLVDNLKNEFFFSKLKNGYPSDEEIERTKKIIKKFKVKNLEELTQFFFKNRCFITCLCVEDFIKVSVQEFGINHLCCVSLPGYTWQCGLKYSCINLQTLQDKDLILTLENNIRGGIISVMGDRYVKSNENKKILYMDATNLYGHSMIQPLPYDEIEMWHGDYDVYMNK